MPVGRLERLVSHIPVLSRLTKRLDDLRNRSERAPDQAFVSISATARSVQRDGLTYLPDEKFRRIESAVLRILERQVPGDIVEFGIALGGSAIVLAEMSSGSGRDFHGFDLFGMIPEPTSVKDDVKSKERYKVIASGKSEGINGSLYYGYRSDLYEEVCASFRRYGLSVDGKRIVLHKGLFEDTLPQYKRGMIAFAHVDCDWYDPVTFCLDNIADRIAHGGAIILDDYNDYGGCRTATHEFLARRHDFSFDNGANAILWKA